MQNEENGRYTGDQGASNHGSQDAPMPQHGAEGPGQRQAGRPETPPNPYNPYSPYAAPSEQRPQEPQDSWHAKDPAPVQPATQRPAVPEENRRFPAETPERETIRKAQNMALAASICGPVSVFVGTVLLSSAGIVCGVIGLRKVKALADRTDEIGAMAQRVKRSCIIAIIISAIATALNIVYLVVLYPMMLEIIETGDYSSLFDGSSADTGSKHSSTWG